MNSSSHENNQESGTAADIIYPGSNPNKLFEMSFLCVILIAANSSTIHFALKSGWAGVAQVWEEISEILRRNLMVARFSKK